MDTNSSVKTNYGDVIFETDVKELRDPFVLFENGKYYMYGTGWICYCSDSLKGPWNGPIRVVEASKLQDAIDCHWAPEVHKYKDEYYMFTTYLSAKTNHRGCTIMKSSDPLGPFVEISDGHITPKDWDSIDGTFYLDDSNKPWIVFVHEWTSMPDKIGSFVAAKLSDDLTKIISEPVTLFMAKDVSWATAGVTDGCFIHKCKDGSLVMLWSNFSKYGYVVATAKSKSGNILGPWEHEEKLLYQKSSIREYDGGHGMLFTAEDGKMYLCLHSPNAQVKDKKTASIFVRVKEECGNIVWDFVK